LENTPKIVFTIHCRFIIKKKNDKTNEHDHRVIPAAQQGIIEKMQTSIYSITFLMCYTPSDWVKGSLRPSNAKRLYMGEKSTEIEVN